jgi:hypothetical protein
MEWNRLPIENFLLGSDVLPDFTLRSKFRLYFSGQNADAKPSKGMLVAHHAPLPYNHTAAFAELPALVTRLLTAI